MRLVDHMREATRHNTLPETVEFVIQNSGLIQHYLTEREGQDRVENLQELVNAATAFIAEEGYGQDATAATLSGEAEPGMVAASPLAAFLSHASLEAGDNQAQAGQDAVQLMTVHSAKGLEFVAVFITGLEEGLFPHENSVNELNGLEEERRLMYVAITRAKERLYLSHTQSRMLHGQVRYNMPSRFLEELPADSLKWLTPKAKDSRWGGRGRSSGRTPPGRRPPRATGSRPGSRPASAPAPGAPWRRPRPDRSHSSPSGGPGSRRPGKGRPWLRERGGRKRMAHTAGPPFSALALTCHTAHATPTCTVSPGP